MSLTPVLGGLHGDAFLDEDVEPFAQSPRVWLMLLTLFHARGLVLTRVFDASPFNTDLLCPQARTRRVRKRVAGRAFAE